MEARGHGGSRAWRLAGMEARGHGGSRAWRLVGMEARRHGGSRAWRLVGGDAESGDLGASSAYTYVKCASAARFMPRRVTAQRWFPAESAREAVHG